MKISKKLRVFSDRLFVSSHGRRAGGGGGGVQRGSDGELCSLKKTVKKTEQNDSKLSLILASKVKAFTLNTNTSSQSL